MKPVSDLAWTEVFSGNRWIRFISFVGGWFCWCLSLTLSAQTNSIDYSVTNSPSYPELIGDYALAGFYKGAPFYQQTGQPEYVLVREYGYWNFLQLSDAALPPLYGNISAWIDYDSSWPYAVSPVAASYSSGTEVIDNGLNRTLSEFGIDTNQAAFVVDTSPNDPAALGSYSPVGFDTNQRLFYRSTTHPDYYLVFHEDYDRWELGSSTSHPPVVTNSTFFLVDSFDPANSSFPDVGPAGLHANGTLIAPAWISATSWADYYLTSEYYPEAEGEYIAAGLDDYGSPWYVNMNNSNILLARDCYGYWYTFEAYSADWDLCAWTDIGSTYAYYYGLLPYDPSQFYGNDIAYLGGALRTIADYGVDPATPLFRVSGSPDPAGDGDYAPAGLDPFGFLYFADMANPDRVIARRLSSSYYSESDLEAWSIGQTAGGLVNPFDSGYLESDVQTDGDAFSPVGSYTHGTIVLPMESTGSDVDYLLFSEYYPETDGHYSLGGLDDVGSPWFFHADDSTLLLARDCYGYWRTFRPSSLNIPLPQDLCDWNNITGYDAFYGLIPYDPLMLDSYGNTLLPGGAQRTPADYGIDSAQAVYRVTSPMDANAQGLYAPAGLDHLGFLYYASQSNPDYVLVRRIDSESYSDSDLEYWSLGLNTNPVVGYSAPGYSEIDDWSQGPELRSALGFYDNGSVVAPVEAAATNIDVLVVSEYDPQINGAYVIGGLDGNGSPWFVHADDPTLLIARDCSDGSYWLPFRITGPVTLPDDLCANHNIAETFYSFQGLFPYDPSQFYDTSIFLGGDAGHALSDYGIDPTQPWYTASSPAHPTADGLYAPAGFDSHGYLYHARLDDPSQVLVRRLENTWIYSEDLEAWSLGVASNPATAPVGFDQPGYLELESRTQGPGTSPLGYYNQNGIVAPLEALQTNIDFIIYSEDNPVTDGAYVLGGLDEVGSPWYVHATNASLMLARDCYGYWYTFSISGPVTLPGDLCDWNHISDSYDWFYGVFPFDPTNNYQATLIPGAADRTLADVGLDPSQPAYQVTSPVDPAAEGLYAPAGLDHLGFLYYTNQSNPDYVLVRRLTPYYSDSELDTWSIGRVTNAIVGFSAAGYVEIDAWSNGPDLSPIGTYSSGSLVLPVASASAPVDVIVHSTWYPQVDGGYILGGLDARGSPWYRHASDPNLILARDCTTYWVAFHITAPVSLPDDLCNHNNIQSHEYIYDWVPGGIRINADYAVYPGGAQRSVEDYGYNALIPLYTVTSPVDAAASGHYVPAGLDSRGFLYFQKHLDPQYILLRRLSDEYVYNENMENWSLGQTSESPGDYTAATFQEIDYLEDGNPYVPTGILTFATTIEVFSGTIPWSTNSATIVSIPAWWTNANISTTNQASYAAANLGQLAWLAYSAREAMSANWSAVGGAGPAINAFIADLLNTNTPPTNFYGAINVGQVKAVAKLFHDRRIALGQATNYPWTTPSDANHHAIANVGQVKHAFHFDIPVLVPTIPDEDNDGLDDGWEYTNFGVVESDPLDDPDGDGLTNLQEQELGTNPELADSDGDGISDWDEVMGPISTDPNNPDSDGDGITDYLEVTGIGSNPNQADTDGDGILDNIDNCPTVANVDQADLNSNGVGSVCDPLEMTNAVVVSNGTITVIPGEVVTNPVTLEVTTNDDTLVTNTITNLVGGVIDASTGGNGDPIPYTPSIRFDRPLAVFLADESTNIHFSLKNVEVFYRDIDLQLQCSTGSISYTVNEDSRQIHLSSDEPAMCKLAAFANGSRVDELQVVSVEISVNPAGLTNESLCASNGITQLPAFYDHETAFDLNITPGEAMSVIDLSIQEGEGISWAYHSGSQRLLLTGGEPGSQATLTAGGPGAVLRSFNLKTVTPMAECPYSTTHSVLPASLLELGVPQVSMGTHDISFSNNPCTSGMFLESDGNFVEFAGDISLRFSTVVGKKPGIHHIKLFYYDQFLFSFPLVRVHDFGKEATCLPVGTSKVGLDFFGTENSSAAMSNTTLEVVSSNGSSQVVSWSESDDAFPVSLQETDFPARFRLIMAGAGHCGESTGLWHTASGLIGTNIARFIQSDPQMAEDVIEAWDSNLVYSTAVDQVVESFEIPDDFVMYNVNTFYAGGWGMRESGIASDGWAVFDSIRGQDQFVGSTSLDVFPHHQNEFSWADQPFYTSNTASGAEYHYLNDEEIGRFHAIGMMPGVLRFQSNNYKPLSDSEEESEEEEEEEEEEDNLPPCHCDPRCYRAPSGPDILPEDGFSQDVEAGLWEAQSNMTYETAQPGTSYQAGDYVLFSGDIDVMYLCLQSHHSSDSQPEYWQRIPSWGHGIPYEAGTLIFEGGFHTAVRTHTSVTRRDAIYAANADDEWTLAGCCRVNQLDVIVDGVDLDFDLDGVHQPPIYPPGVEVGLIDLEIHYFSNWYSDDLFGNQYNKYTDAEFSMYAILDRSNMSPNEGCWKITQFNTGSQHIEDPYNWYDYEWGGGSYDSPPANGAVTLHANASLIPGADDISVTFGADFAPFYSTNIWPLPLSFPGLPEVTVTSQIYATGCVLPPQYLNYEVDTNVWNHFYALDLASTLLELTGYPVRGLISTNTITTGLYSIVSFTNTVTLSNTYVDMYLEDAYVTNNYTNTAFIRADIYVQPSSIGIDPLDQDLNARNELQETNHFRHWIEPNNQDLNANGVVDYADGLKAIPTLESTPMSVGHLPAGFKPLFLSSMEHIHYTGFTFDYDANDPAALTPGSTQAVYIAADPSASNGLARIIVTNYPAANGTFRIWTKDRNHLRDPRSITEGGDFIPSGVHISPELFFPDGTPGQITLYLEAIKACENKDIKITQLGTLNGNGVSGEDTLTVSALSLDLFVDADNDGWLTTENAFALPEESFEENLAEDWADQPGKVIPVNNRDYDGDDLPDYADGYNLSGFAGSDELIHPHAKFTPVVFELPAALDDELATITFKYPESNPTNLFITNGIPYPESDGLRLWTKDAGTSRDAGDDFLESGKPFTLEELSDIAVNGKVTLYVEAVSPSSLEGDIILTATLSSGDTTGMVSFSQSDTIRFTAVDIYTIRAGSRQAAAYMPVELAVEAFPTNRTFETYLQGVPGGAYTYGESLIIGHKLEPSYLIVARDPFLKHIAVTNEIEFVEPGTPGSSTEEFGLGSMHLKFPLGSGLGGRDLGYLEVKAEYPPSRGDLYLLTMLYNYDKPEVSFDFDSDPAPGKTVGIMPSDVIRTPLYEIDVSHIDDGFRLDYKTSEDNSPVMTYTVQRDPASPRQGSGWTLHVDKEIDNDAFRTTYVYTHSGSTRIWDVQHPDGITHSRRTTDNNPGGVFTKTETTEYFRGQVRDYVEVKRYGDREMVLEYEVGEGADALLTKYLPVPSDSDTDSLKYHRVEYANGHVVNYTFNDDGYVESEKKHWLDSVNADVTTYNYDPIHPLDPGNELFRNRPRQVTRTLSGIVVQERVFGFVDEGYTYKVIEREGNSFDSPAYIAAADNLETVSIYHKSGPFAHQLTYQENPIQGSTVIKRATGKLEAGEGSEPVFRKTGNGPDVQIRTLQTIAGGGAGNKTLSKIVRSPSGHILQSEIKNSVRPSRYPADEAQWARADFLTSTWDHFRRPLQQQHQDGSTASYAWGTEPNDLLAMTNRLGVVTTIQGRDFKHRITDQTIQAASTIHQTFGYNAIDQLLTRTDTSEGEIHTTVNTYTSAGRIQSNTTEFGVTEYSYDDANNQVTVTTPTKLKITDTTYKDGQFKSRRQVDASDNLDQLTEQHEYTPTQNYLQHELWYGPDKNGPYQQQKIDWKGMRIESKTRGPNNNFLTSTYGYDAYRQQSREIPSIGLELGTDIDLETHAVEVSFGENPVAHSRTSWIDQQGDRWQLVETLHYDDQGQEHLEQATYTLLNNFSAQRTALTLVRDGSSNVVRSTSTFIPATGTDPEQEHVQEFFTTASPVEDIPQPASIPLVSRERYRFGQLIRQEDAQGNTNQFVYGKFNRLKDTIVAGAGTTTREYHPNGLLHKLIAPDGRTTQFDYDDVGRLDVQMDPTGATTRQRHDSRNRLTHIWGSAVQPVHFTYDDLNRRTHINRYSQGSFNSVNLPAAFGSPDHTTEFVLEPATGLLKEKIYPNDKSTVYTYTDDGLPETRTWERGITRTNVYNSARQLVEVLYNDDTPPVVLANYDRQGRFRSVFDAQGFRIFDFNAQSQRKLEHMLSGITGASYQLDYRRNDPLWPGRLNRIELRLGTFYSAPIEGLLHTSFDELGRPDTLDFTGGNGTEHVEYDYHPQRGWVTDRDYIGGSSGATTVRNPVSGVIDSKTNDRGGASGLISRFTGEYTDRLERDFLGVEGAMVGAGYHFDYEHDTRQRLTEAHKRSGLTSSAGLTDVPRSTDYDYDLAGNRTELTIGTNDFGYSVNNLDQATAISSNGTNLAVLLYDADGNLTNDGTFAYDYDAENRLVMATPLVAVTGSLAVVSQYDYLDRRFLKEVYRWEAAGWQMARRHHFIWDRNLPVYEKQEDGAGQVIREVNYGWGLDLSETRQGAHGVGGLQSIFVTEAGTTKSYSCWYDLNGNLTELVNESGAIAAHYQYNAYGQVIGEWADTNDSFAVSNAFGFATKYTDQETGLVYFGRRYYSPMLGRWINRDPIEESGGYNLYAYGLNDPVNRFDPNGEVAWFVWAARVAWSAGRWGLKRLATRKALGVGVWTGVGVGSDALSYREDFHLRASIGKNLFLSTFGLNVWHRLGKAYQLSRADKFAVGMGIVGAETGVGAGFDAGFMGQDVNSAVVANGLGSLGGAVLGSLASGLWRNAPSGGKEVALGRWENIDTFWGRLVVRKRTPHLAGDIPDRYLAYPVLRENKELINSLSLAEQAFPKSVFGRATVRELEDLVPTYTEVFLRSNAKKIRFDLTNIEHAAKRFDPINFNGFFARMELQMILENPTLLAKTVFYRNGRKIWFGNRKIKYLKGLLD